MKLYLQYNNQDIFEFTVKDEIFNKCFKDREIICLAYAKVILNNISERVDKRYSVIRLFEKIMDESINAYQDVESYEKCQILKEIRDCVSVEKEENRRLIKNS